MKKIFSMFFAAFFAVVMMAGGAMAAAYIDDDTTVGADDFDDVVIAQEMCSATLKLAKDFETGDVGDDTSADKYIAVGGAARGLYYSANLGLNLDWTLKFELTNAIFNNTTMALLYNEANNGDFDLDGSTTVNIVKVGQLISGGEGESQATFIVTGYNIPADSVLTISSADGAETSLAILSDATSGTITLALTEAKTDGGTDVDAAEADAVTIVTFEPQIAMTVTTAATSVIAVASDRLNFNDKTSGANDSEQFANEDTEPTMSAALLTLDNDSDSSINDTITLDASDTITMTITPSTDFAGIAASGIYYNIDNGDAPAGDNEVDEVLTVGITSADATFTLNVGGADTAPNILCAAGNADVKKLVIIVDGATALDTRTFNVTVTLDLDDEPGDKTLINDQLSHTWDIDGAQVVVPYFNTDTTNYGTYVLINNISSTLPGNIEGDVYTDGGSAQLATGVDFGTVDVQSTKLLTATYIQTKVEDAGVTGVTRYMIKFIITTPADNTFVTAFQLNGPGGGKRAVPTYKWQGGQWCE